MILLLDNYDSFVHNLARYFRLAGEQTDVVRSDAITVAEIGERQPSAIVISPGPCTPDEAGVSIAAIRDLGSEIPILGVCLGHQAIAAAFGGRVVRADVPVHGRTSAVTHNRRGLFEGLPLPVTATRYHSLVVEPESLPAELEVTATSAGGVIMGLSHRTFPVRGVQFHPESILTAAGDRLIRNFVDLSHSYDRSTCAGN
ncbi:anthranilate synthase component II [Stratiformator vulcanicus]|uniref:Aminodeoxychorismate synthase component 2 n=1 Tax=Stratiformator vulcanicus TaxID=2527980 RepID=A0A517R614_9PLAN|nr:aminodeoxychorismate/anthranilate synthase component II [Stratiformator vulcanicus]QDT39328.1 Aminodeoxychorismate synthase component 2 [Stratiformator vulcanicus]